MTNEEMNVVNGLMERYSDLALYTNKSYEELLYDILAKGDFSSEARKEVELRLTSVFNTNSKARMGFDKFGKESIDKMSNHELGESEAERLEGIYERYGQVITKEQLDYNKIFAFMVSRGNISKDSAKAFDELNDSIDQRVLELKNDKNRDMNDLENPKEREERKKALQEIYDAFH